MRITPLAIALLVASPAFGQARVYTNADLGKPLPRATAVTPAEAAAILAPWQFVYLPPRPTEAQVVVIESSPTAGPFGEFTASGPSEFLDGWLNNYPTWFSTSSSWRSRGVGRGGLRRNDLRPGLGPGIGFSNPNGGNRGANRPDTHGDTRSNNRGRGTVAPLVSPPSPVAPPPAERVVPAPVPLGFPAHRR